MWLSSLLTRLSRDSGKHAFVSKQILFSLAIIGVLTGCSPRSKITQVRAGGDCVLPLDALPEALDTYPMSDVLVLHGLSADSSSRQHQIEALVTRNSDTEVSDTTLVPKGEIVYCLLGTEVPECAQIDTAIQNISSDVSAQVDYFNQWFGTSSGSRGGRQESSSDNFSQQRLKFFLQNAGIDPRNITVTLAISDRIVLVLTAPNVSTASMPTDLDSVGVLTYLSALSMHDWSTFARRAKADYQEVDPNEWCNLNEEERVELLQLMEENHDALNMYFDSALEKYEQYCPSFSAPHYRTIKDYNSAYLAYINEVSALECEEVNEESEGLLEDSEQVGDCTSTAGPSIVFSANCPEGDVTIRVFNSSSHEVCFENIVVTPNTQRELSSCTISSPGLYIVFVQFSDGTHETHKIMLP